MGATSSPVRARRPPAVRASVPGAVAAGGVATASTDWTSAGSGGGVAEVSAFCGRARAAGESEKGEGGRRAERHGFSSLRTADLRSPAAK